MPQPHPAVPQCPIRSTPSRRARIARRALVLAGTSFALTAAGASAQASTGGGAEAGAAPAPQPASAPAATRAAPAASTALTRATIRTVQRKLRLKADGILGPRTRAAIRRYQRRHRLPVSGRLHPATLEALGVKGRAARAAAPPTAPAPTGRVAQVLAGIAECESGGDPTIVSANGQHRGKYQFLQSTWEAQGGVGDPAKAPEAEQDQRAAQLYAAQGAKPWPVCGPKAEAAVS